MTTTINASLSAGLVQTADTSGVLQLQTGGTTALTVDASQNVGIGTSSPAGKLVVVDASGTVALRLQRDANNRLDFYQGGGISYIDSSPASAQLAFSTVGAERARIDSSGNLLVGTTSAVIASPRISVRATGNPTISSQRTETTGTQTIHAFYDGSDDFCGQISIDAGSNTTSYSTSSDYRLKHNITPMSEALAKVAALKPVNYKWNSDNSNGQGFIAHELQAVVPDCVTGEKDAVETVEIKDEEGNVTGTEQRPVYQGIDTSFLVATLTAAIQEQQALITALTARITALEGAAA